jgi:hypothetical protein
MAGQQIDGGSQIKVRSVTPDRMTNGAPIGEDLFENPGDMPVGSAAGLAGRLPVGSNGWVLTADNTQPLGVHWAPVGLGFGHDIEDEGSVLPTRAAINFVGVGVSVADDALNDATVVTVPGPTQMMARSVTAKSSGALAVGASAQSTVTLANSARLLRVAADRACRVRMYTRSGVQAGDESRPTSTAPTGDHGVVLDVVLTAAMLSLDLVPQVDVSDLKATPDGLIPITITNTATSSGTTVVTLTYLRTE